MDGAGGGVGGGRRSLNGLLRPSERNQGFVKGRYNSNQLISDQTNLADNLDLGISITGPL